MSPLVPIGEVLRLTLGATAPLEPVVVELDESLGCVLAEMVIANDNVPPFSNSSMDGFAVRSADTLGAPVVLRVLDTALAGRPSSLHVGAGEAIRIMTGAAMPSGADAVCMVERTHTDDRGATVVIDTTVEPGQFVRAPGDDLRSGSLVFDEGAVLGPAHVGVLASLGHSTVRVHPRPRVGILSTGDELIEGPLPLAPGQIRDSNRHALLGLVRSSGFVGVDLGIVPDDRDQLTASLHQAGASCDAVLTSGGVSVGDADLVKVVLEELCGGTMRSLSVAVRPAKPFAFGRLAATSTPVFGLPGNPVSSLVSFELFVRPALRQMAGHASRFRPVIAAIADEPLERASDAKVHVVSVRAHIGEDGRVHVSVAGVQASHVLSSMACANALALLPDGHGVAAGGEVETLILDADSLGGVGAIVTVPRAVSA